MGNMHVKLLGRFKMHGTDVVKTRAGTNGPQAGSFFLEEIISQVLARSSCVAVAISFPAFQKTVL